MLAISWFFGRDDLVYLPVPLKAMSNEPRRIDFGRTHAILFDLVEDRPITYLQQPRSGFAIPTGLLERGIDCISFRFRLDILNQRLERSCTGCVSARLISPRHNQCHPIALGETPSRRLGVAVV